MVEIKSCDICGRNIDTNNCYLLTTKQVVKSPLYWQNYYNMHKVRFSQLGITSYEDLLSQIQIRADFGTKLYQSPSPWLVCGDCINMFIDVDSNECFRYAQEWIASNGNFVPPGSGPAKLEDVNMGDGHIIYRGSEYVPTKVVDTVVCSICGHALRYTGAPGATLPETWISLDSSYNEMELWVGLVCMTCGVVFCHECLEPRSSTPCPRCGTMTQPAGRLQLQKIGKICSTSR